MIQTQEQLKNFISLAHQNSKKILDWLLCKEKPNENIDNRKFSFRISEADKIFDFYMNLHNLDYMGINQNGIIDDEAFFEEKLFAWQKDNPLPAEDLNKKVKIWIKENVYNNKTLNMLQWVIPTKSVYFFSVDNNFEKTLFQLIKNIIYSFHKKNTKIVELDFRNKATLKTKYNYATILSAVVNELEKMLLLHNSEIFPEQEPIKASFEYFNLYHKMEHREFFDYAKVNYNNNVFLSLLQNDLFLYFKLKFYSQEINSYEELSPSLLFDYFESYLTFVMLFHFNMHYNYSILDLELQTSSSFLPPSNYDDKIKELTILKKDLFPQVLPLFFDLVLDFNLENYSKDLTKKQVEINPENMKSIYFTPTQEEAEKALNEIDNNRK